MTEIAAPADDVPRDEPVVSDSAWRSRLLRADRERERLERVLLMLPQAFGGLSIEHLVEVFACAALELSGARVSAAVLPEHIAEPILSGSEMLAEPGSEQLSSLPLIAPAMSGNLVYVSDTHDLDFLEIGRFSGGREVRSVVAIPISGRTTEPLGALVLLHHRVRAFSERRIALARSLATQLGHEIELTGSMNEQSRIALSLQQSLLPPVMPTIPGLELSARYRPSGRGNLVGGDFYDVFPDAAGGWFLLLGDASGIGPEAAGLAGIVRYTARALAESALSPAAMLEDLNRALLRSATGGRFCTAVIVRIVVRSDGADVSIASAGHPPAYLLGADGKVAPALSFTGLVLGVEPEGAIGTVDLILGRGDALVLYTDGVTEARDQSGTIFGEEGLAEVLNGSFGRSAEGISRRLERAVLDHRGGRDKDDVAILAIRLAPEGLSRSQ